MGGIGDDSYIVDIIKTSKGALALQNVATESPNQGNDTLQLRALTNLNFSTVPAVTLAANFENLDATLVDSSNKINLTGNSADNIITGNDADNILNGGLGADTMIGGAGNDTYILDNVNDVVNEGGADLRDKVIIAYKNSGTAVTIELSDYANIEDLTVTGTGLYNINGTSGDNILTGNASANILTGGDGNDTLDGLGGIDTLIGGNGDDTYVIDNIGDIVNETGADANDTVIIKIAKGHFSLASFANIENLTLTGTAAQNLTGDSGINTLTGNSGANVLDGAGGADTLIGGSGNDTYKVYGESETITELANGGTDTVISTDSFTLGANLENLTLAGTSDINATGNTLANILIGNAYNNILDGKEGIDTLVGGLGDDTYRVNLSLVKNVYKLEDAIRELNGQGNDTVVLRNDNNYAPLSAFNLVLALYLENLDVSGTGTLKVNLTGNAGNNTLTGNDAANILDGGAGIDTLIGGAGDDLYVFDNTGDTATEFSGEGNDTIRIAYRNASVTPVTILMADPAYDHIENIMISGTGIFNVTGNDLNNHLVGNASANTLIGGLGNDILNGGLGNDILDGGDGDDVYFVNTLGDIIIDSDGTDIVFVDITSGTYVVPASVEWAQLLGTKSINLTGNDSNNYLIGNAGANIINGGLGEDLMEGGKGNDTYYVDHAGDIVSETYSEGTDTIISSMDFSLTTRGFNVENLTLTGNAVAGVGNALNNIIIGNNNNNILDGKGGLDTLKGGLGNDLYLVDFIKSGSLYKMAATVTELAGQGEDTIRLRDNASLVMTAAVTLTVGANIENFDILETGSLKINVTGNALNNFLVGNDGNNILNGGAGHDKLWGYRGADTLIGGTGNDRFYYVDGSSESSLGQMDIIKDFSIGDKITFEGASGLSYYGEFGSGFASVSIAVNVIENYGGIDDGAVYFRVGSNGYLYIKGDGDGLGTDFGGTLIMAEKKTSAFQLSDIEFNTVFENEGITKHFSLKNTVVGSLADPADTDTYSFNLAAPGVIEMNFDIPTAFYASQPSYKVQLIDSNGMEIGEWSMGSDRKISVPLSFAGDYSVVISGISSAKFSVDPYSFTVKEDTTTAITVDDTPIDASLLAGQTHMYKVDLLAGEIYSFDALSVAGMNGKGLDPKLRIYDETGRQLMVNDDTALRYMKQNGDEIDGNSADAHAAFIAPVSGTYYVSVESGFAPVNPIKSDMVTGYRGTLNYVDYKSSYEAAGSYSLQVVKHDKQEMITSLVAGGSYNQLVDLGNPIQITFGFPTAFPSEFTAPGNYGIYSHGYVAGTFRGFSEAQKAEIREMMDYWETFTGIDFVEADAATAQIKFGWMKNTNGSGGSAYGFDSNGAGPYYTADEDYFLKGPTTVLLNSVAANPQTTNIGTASFWNLIAHELGHAIGFEHSDTYTHFSNYQQTNVLPFGFDFLKFSVMSYIGDMGMTIMPSTVQLFDIAAAQHLYGANMNHESGATIWDFTDATKEYYQTIWDSGGEDTIDASGQTLGSIIYLQEGASSSIGKIGKYTDVSASDLMKAVIPGEFGDRAYNNVTIAFDVEIENAKGGAGDDIIFGNGLDNKLWGNSGSDLIKGGDGNDTLYGGTGHDLLYGGAGEDIFVFDGAVDESSSDVIADFDINNDTLHLEGILEGFDPLAPSIADFVSIVTDGANSSVMVDIDGAGTGHSMTLLAVLTGVTGQDADTWFDNGTLTIA